jgi:hypothetical protein
LHEQKEHLAEAGTRGQLHSGERHGTLVVDQELIISGFAILISRFSSVPTEDNFTVASCQHDLTLMT